MPVMAVFTAEMSNAPKTQPTRLAKRGPTKTSPIYRSMSFWCSLAPSGRHIASTQSRAVPSTTSTVTASTARRAVTRTEGRSRVEPGSSLSTPVLLAATSTPESARIISTKLVQLPSRLPLGACAWKCPICGVPLPISPSTTTTAGTASHTAMPPVCLGPRKLITPMMKMVVIAHFFAVAGSATPR